MIVTYMSILCIHHEQNALMFFIFTVCGPFDHLSSTSKAFCNAVSGFFLSLNLITHIHVHSYSTNQQGILDNAVPVLLVDGYNVCGYWMKLKKHFVKGRLDIARQKLIDELLTFSMLRGLSLSLSLSLFHCSATLFFTSFLFFFHLYRGQNRCCL